MTTERATRRQLVAVWAVVAVVFGGLLGVAKATDNPLDDPDPAPQRPGFLDAGNLPQPAPRLPTGAPTRRRNHFVPGRNLTWYAVSLGSFAVYVLAVDRAAGA